MVDLPDYYTQAQISEAEAASFKGGLDANKSATPVSRNLYLATDTKILHICIADGFWTGFDASILVQGILTLYETMDANNQKISNLAAPVADNDAARKAYVDAQISGDVATHAALTATHGVAGTIAGLADIATHAALTATHGVAGTIAGVADIATHAALTTGVHGAGANTLATDADIDADIATHAALTATHGVTGAIVGTTNTQTLSAKTLTSPTINGTIATTGLTLPAVTLGGAVTLAGYVFDAGAGSAQVNSTGAAAGLVAQVTNDGADGARLRLIHVSASPANNDRIGILDSRAKDDGGTERAYSFIYFKIEDVQVASNAGYMEFYNRAGAASNKAMTLSSAGKLWLDAGLDVDSNLINNVLDPVSAQDAATKNYVDTELASYLPLAGGTMAGNIAMGNNKVTGLAAASATGEAARYDELNKAIVSDVSASRTVDSIYQNTSGKVMLVFACFQYTGVGDAGTMQGKIGSASPPTQIIDQATGDQAIAIAYTNLSFIVPNNYYYACYATIGDQPSVTEWLEIALH